MSLKEKFLVYVELQRNANDIKNSKGSSHNDSIAAYEKANIVKREILNALDDIEG